MVSASDITTQTLKKHSFVRARFRMLENVWNPANEDDQAIGAFRQKDIFFLNGNIYALFQYLFLYVRYWSDLSEAPASPFCFFFKLYWQTLLNGNVARSFWLTSQFIEYADWGASESVFRWLICNDKRRSVNWGLQNTNIVVRLVDQSNRDASMLDVIYRTHRVDRPSCWTYLILQSNNSIMVI